MASHSTWPPCWGGHGSGTALGSGDAGRCGCGCAERSPDSCSSGTPAPSSELPAPGEPRGASREGPRWESQGAAGRHREGRREERTCPVPRRGGEEKGAGGVPPLREGVGPAWGGAAGTAGWGRAPGWPWGSLGGKGKGVSQRGEFGGRSRVEERAVTFAGHPVPAEPVAGPAGAEEAARCVVARVLARTALARLPALVDVCGMRSASASPAAAPRPGAARRRGGARPGRVSTAWGGVAVAARRGGVTARRTGSCCDGAGPQGRRAALTHAGVPVPVEVVAGPAGAAVAAHAVLAAVLARRGQALVGICRAEAEAQRPG